MKASIPSEKLECIRKISQSISNAAVQTTAVLSPGASLQCASFRRVAPSSPDSSIWQHPSPASTIRSFLIRAAAQTCSSGPSSYITERHIFFMTTFLPHQMPFSFLRMWHHLYVLGSITRDSGLLENGRRQSQPMNPLPCTRSMP